MNSVADDLRAKKSYRKTREGVEKYNYTVEYPFDDYAALKLQESTGGPAACDVIRELVHEYVANNRAKMPTIEGGKVEGNALTLNIRIEGVNPSNIVVG